ncbi:pyridoxamine 5'-phosphate oxidase family protein [Candidatus Pacearchaeota archaeon]|nr:pyridoxamine 5'-phosphate oxidase family protein [Candidatus Pacearchaeota archaeon]
MTILNNGIKNMIENNALGFASIDKSGKPHNIAVGFVKVVSNNELVISDNYLNETVENIKINPSVSLVVWSRDWEENCAGYELKGTVEYFTEGNWIDFIKKIPVNRNEPCKGAILVKLNKIKILS